MKLGLRLPTYIFDPQESGHETASLETLLAYSRRAEELGFDSLWVVDHYLVAAPSYRVAFLDPLVVLSAVISATDRLRVGTSVLQLPLRQPVMLAKQIATLDWLSNGRFDFGIGSGWQEKEFEGAGVPIRQRGRRLDEYLAAMIALWTEDSASFHGEFVNFDDITLLPRPVQKPYPKLSFGGGSTVPAVYADDRGYSKPTPKTSRVLRRIGRYADAWQATSTSEPTLLERDWEEICQHAEEAGRNPSEIERMQTTYMILTEDPEEARRLYGGIVGKDFDDFLQHSSYLYGSATKLADELHKREEMGIDRMILTPVRSDLDELDEWATEFLGPFLGGKP
jgi:probable F420-dependent oxidoreductase